METKFSREEEVTAEWEINDDSTDLILNDEKEIELETMAFTRHSFLSWKHHDY